MRIPPPVSLIHLENWQGRPIAVPKRPGSDQSTPPPSSGVLLPGGNGILGHPFPEQAGLRSQEREVALIWRGGGRFKASANFLKNTLFFPPAPPTPAPVGSPAPRRPTTEAIVDN